MIKGKEILGRNIVALSSGEKVDTVRDVVFDHQGNQVLAFLVDEGGWFRSAKAVPFERVRSIGEDAIMIGSPDDITTSREDQRLDDALESKTNLMGMALLTTDGQHLGRISDVYFDEHSGAVVGYEATGGLFADLTGGRSFVPAPSDVQIGADAAIVPISVAHAMKENPGGIRGAIKTVSDAVTGSVQHASDSVREGYESATESVRGGYQAAADSVRQTVENISEATVERQQQYVTGKVSSAEIVADDGTVIVKKGETITALHAEVAEWNHKLPALIAAATGGTIAQATQQAGDSVREAYADVAHATKERQKAYVTGKVAGADILLENGLAIVRKGDTITAAQADAAEKAGKLVALATAATGGSLGTAYEGVKDRVQDRDAGTSTAQGAAPIHLVDIDFTSPSRVQDTLGRRVKADVRVGGGSLLAVQGQIITPEIVARAEQLGAQQALMDATLAEPTGASSSAAPLGASVDSVRESASNLLNKAKGWLSDKREETEAALSSREEELQNQRIRDALGRPVTRVILAPDDSIILNVGEVITNKAVEAARQGDVLDILLDSVSKEAPRLDPLNTRPAESGQAALDSQTAPESKPES